jgi:hypothetical protein
VRALGYEGTVVEPGEWGRLVNGGAWLTIDEVRVDLLYRDLDQVKHWTAEAEAGRFEIDLVEGFVAGMPTYALAGELALGRVLVGELPQPSFPQALRESAPRRWLGSAEFSLDVAEAAAARADTVACNGLLARAAIAVAQARLAERGEWVLNEKGIVRRADIGHAEAILAAVGSSPYELGRAVFALRVAVGLPAGGAGRAGQDEARPAGQP